MRLGSTLAPNYPYNIFAQRGVAVCLNKNSRCSWNYRKADGVWQLLLALEANEPMAYSVGACKLHSKVRNGSAQAV